MGRLSADSLRLLAFGFAFAFFSSFGQTFYIAIFGGEIRDAFGLTHGTFGAIYSGATLLSGFLMIRVGGLMDRVRLRPYALAAVFGLAAANLALGLAPSLVGLAVAIFLLRLFGQGMMTHAAVTAMARSFDKGRGRAISFATLGLPVGQATFPALGVLALGLYGWRSAWFLGALACLVIVLPLAFALLRNGIGNPVSGRAPAPFVAWRFLTRREVALAMPALMAPAFTGTAVFFHQVLIGEVKGWSAADFALGFVVFSVASVLSMPVAGWLVDRFSARRMARYFLLPSAAGLIALASTEALWALHAYMILSAVTFGAFATVSGSLFAEVYGPEQLGSIRATASAMGVVSSALSPVMVGVGYDAGIGLDILIGAMGVLTLVTVALLSASRLTAAEGAPA